MTAIKRTRLKFFAVMSVVIVVIVSAFCASILIITEARNTAATNAALKKMIENFNSPVNPNLPQTLDGGGQPDTERFNNIRGFTIKLNSDFEILKVKSTDSLFSEEIINEYVAEIKKAGKSSGKIGDLVYLIEDTKDGKILACLDVSMENSMYNELLASVLFAGGGGMLVLLVLVWFLSFWIIKPTADAFQKQKRFISEAGHELKTPLSVISASVELLQKNIKEGDSENLTEIMKRQIEKMSVMAADLLTLSKLDETETVKKTEFDLSQTILAEALAFESIAFENGKKFVCDTDGGIIYKGDSQAVRQAVGILCDNAIKYSESACAVEIRLKKQAAKTVLSVSNATGAVKEEEVPFLFERFYRGSESRAETDGTGLGLSILKTLADKNGWKLSAKIEQGNIVFSIVF